MLDLVENGSSWEEVVELGKQIEAAGASIINTGIGWHEARIPTIVTSVPRANFTWVTEKIRRHINIPLITTNRINNPETAETILAAGQVDMVSMARPLLADPDFMKKAQNNQADLINTCIACNQACLDHAFKNQLVSCLVNPRACEETELNFETTLQPKSIAVVGAGPAGIAFAVYASQRGHQVTLLDAADKIGGQLNIANQVPGKEEFYETLRYFKNMLIKNKVEVRLNTNVTVESLKREQFDELVIATGILPRVPKIKGVEHSKVLSYIDVLKHKKAVGKSVAVIGAGGIGFDVAEFLTHNKSLTTDPEAWNREWGVDPEYTRRGGLAKNIEIEASPRKVFLLQRKKSKVGAGLGKTSGWTHRLSLKHKKVKMLNDVEYLKIDEQGLHINQSGKETCLEVDNVILCAGQLSNTALYEAAKNLFERVHLIGGADVAAELDAKRAIRQGAILASKI
jgi:2,4-dienoyl-CoA reductase (NADPH2)